MSFLAEAPPEEVEFARHWDALRKRGETLEEFAERMGWPNEPEKEMPF